MTDSLTPVDFSIGPTYARVKIGLCIPSVTMELTLQRLVMQVGANRDIYPIHHDRDFAKRSGAPDAYANTTFILAMFERTLREWIGMNGHIKKIGPFKMDNFMKVGDIISFQAVVTGKKLLSDQGLIELNIQAINQDGMVSVKGRAEVSVPLDEIEDETS